VLVTDVCIFVEEKRCGWEVTSTCDATRIAPSINPLGERQDRSTGPNHKLMKGKSFGNQGNQSRGGMCCGRNLTDRGKPDEAPQKSLHLSAPKNQTSRKTPRRWSPRPVPVSSSPIELFLPLPRAWGLLRLHDVYLL
jgi:hypothetical protein